MLHMLVINKVTVSEKRLFYKMLCFMMVISALLTTEVKAANEGAKPTTQLMELPDDVLAHMAATHMTGAASCNPCTDKS